MAIEISRGLETSICIFLELYSMIAFIFYADTFIFYSKFNMNKSDAIPSDKNFPFWVVFKTWFSIYNNSCSMYFFD